MNFQLPTEDFELLKKTFEENNPELARDPVAIRARIAEFDRDIQDHIITKPADFGTAVVILWQGRNFLAHYVGDTQTLLPEEALTAVTEIQPEPINTKHVAIYVDGEGPLKASVKKVLEISSWSLRIMLYDSVRELLIGLLAGKVCGVVGVRLDQQARIERHIRHDLKNMPGWNYEKAEAVVLPPCFDFSPAHQFPLILKAIMDMQTGTYNLQTAEEFNLQSQLPSLVARMRVRSREIVIAVVDDRVEEMRGMIQILEAWPCVKCVQIVQHADEIPHVTEPVDVWLLDEDMPLIKGTSIAREFQTSGISGLLASTTGGNKPEFTQWHFGNKSRIIKEFRAAEEFVQFINQLLLLV